MMTTMCIKLVIGAGNFEELLPAPYREVFLLAMSVGTS